ncbi:hypothetical protein AK88_00789 [Plasmodium fragile]|uniref:PCIF1 WW domain-containing protein n=1 Tax=Plasmodium fragile TaxID=5857 RepID=A0A0D9QRN3_PLAFR|nr:uncharacterized protein AK88_00789 [Plasmodium fragile]KJP89578.1 hypothetical protein AK88_00789 [Plasmodium fragile]
MTQQSVGSPRRRLDLHKELTFQREIMKLRKAFLNVYTLELFYKKNLKIKNEYLNMIKRRDREEGERNPRGRTMRQRVRCINRKFLKAHQMKGQHYHEEGVELKRQVCFLEKEIMNRFLFSLHIDQSNFSFDANDTYLYWLFVRFVRRVHVGSRKGNTIGCMNDHTKDTAPLFCDARYVKQFCAFIAPLVKRHRANPHFTFLQQYVQRLDFAPRRKTRHRGREKNSSWGTSLRYHSMHVGNHKHGHHQKGNCKRMRSSSSKISSHCMMTLSICPQHPTYNLSLHRKSTRSSPLSVHRVSLKFRTHQLKVNVAKVKHAVGKYILGQLYENSLNSIFSSLVSKSSQFKCNLLGAGTSSDCHCCGEEAVFSGAKSHLEESSCDTSEPTHSAIVQCLQVFFTPVHEYSSVKTRDELILLLNNFRNVLEEDVRKLLHMTAVNISPLCEHLPLGYLFPVFLFYFLFLNIPLGSCKMGVGHLSCSFEATTPKQCNIEEDETHNVEYADRCSDDPPRCLLCLYEALRRNKNMTPLQKKKWLVFFVLDSLRKSYVKPVDQEESILSLYFNSVVNSACMPREGELKRILYKEGKRDEGTHHHSPLCYYPWRRHNTRKRRKVREGEEMNSVKTEKWPRRHNVERIFQRCFERLNRTESFLGHLDQFINPKGSNPLNVDCQKGKKKKIYITCNCAMYSPPCELYCVPPPSGRGGQSVRWLFGGNTAKENNSSNRISKKGGVNSTVKKTHPLGLSNQLQDKQGVLPQATLLHEYLLSEEKIFLDNLKAFLRPLLNALYKKSIVRMNMYFYLCMVHSFLTLRRAGISPKCMSRKGREALYATTHTVTSTTRIRRHLSGEYQRGRPCKPVEDYLAWKFDRAVYLLCTRSGSSAIAKRRLRGTTSYMQNCVKNINVRLLLLVYRMANAADVQTFGGVTTHVSRGSNLALHRRSNTLAQTISRAACGKINTKRQRRKNVRPYIRMLLKSAPIQNYNMYEHLQGDCFYIQRKNDFVIFNLRSKEGEKNGGDSPNVYYPFNGTNYFVHQKDYRTRRTYKIKCVNVCLLFYRYCFFFYTRNPLVFSFLLNRVFCVCAGCLGRYLVLDRVANSGTPHSEDATTHDCFYKQIGMLIKNRKNIFVRYFNFLVLFLIMRYHTLIGSVRHSGLQSCVPKRIMTLLRRKLNIKRECFSSPLNAILPSYCSFFPDIDTFFGSSGNFFEFPLRSGAYEVNPPFDVYLINQVIVYILHHLNKEEHELTFFLVIPMLQDKNYLFELLFGSPHLSAHFLLARNSYTFSTRLLESREEEYISTCDCCVFILQNEKAKIQKGLINKKVVLKIKKKWENLSHIKQKKKE